MTALTAAQLIELLGLKPLPGEGGYYAETWRSPFLLSGNESPEDGPGNRHAGTAIYFLITPDAFSALHRLRSDEMFHFYAGDPVDLVTIDPAGNVLQRRLGTDLIAGERPQLLAPGGCWQGSALVPGGAWALLGTTMAPGYDQADFELGDPDELVRQFPHTAALIRRLTRSTSG